jgi:hypothetical protein
MREIWQEEVFGESALWVPFRHDVQLRFASKIKLALFFAPADYKYSTFVCGKTGIL